MESFFRQFGPSFGPIIDRNGSFSRFAFINGDRRPIRRVPLYLGVVIPFQSAVPGLFNGRSQCETN